MIIVKLTMGLGVDYDVALEGWDELLQDIAFQPRKGSDAVDLLQMVAG